MNEIIDFKNANSTTIQTLLKELPERVVEGDPLHQTTVHFESENSLFQAGIWKSTKGKWRAFAGRDEFCVIVRGKVRLTSENGISRDFEKGDAFVVPSDFNGYWEVLEDAEKFFFICRH